MHKSGFCRRVYEILDPAARDMIKVPETNLEEVLDRSKQQMKDRKELSDRIQQENLVDPEFPRTERERKLKLAKEKTQREKTQKAGSLYRSLQNMKKQRSRSRSESVESPKAPRSGSRETEKNRIGQRQRNVSNKRTASNKKGTGPNRVTKKNADKSKSRSKSKSFDGATLRVQGKDEKNSDKSKIEAVEEKEGNQ